MKRLVEIRSYKLKPGATAAFHQAFVTAAVPLLRSFERMWWRSGRQRTKRILTF